MGIAYDSGWQAVASGALSATVDCNAFDKMQVIYAASGAAGLASSFLSWSAGAQTPVPWKSPDKNWIDPPCLPLITGTYSVSQPAASASVIYYFGTSMSGANHLDDWVPQTLRLGMLPGAASWGRIIVIGK